MLSEDFDLEYFGIFGKFKIKFLSYYFLDGCQLVCLKPFFPFLNIFSNLITNKGLTLSYTGEGGGGVGGGGGRGHKVPALVSKIRILATNTATGTTFGDFS